MSDSPKFRLYGEGDTQIEEAIQPKLSLRPWSDLQQQEKVIALQQVINSGWLEDYSPEILWTIAYLNREFLRQCPGKRLHACKPERDAYRGHSNDFNRMKAAIADFKDLFVNERSDALVLRLLSRLAQCYIDDDSYKKAGRAENEEDRKIYLAAAFGKFDWFANCLNHIFEQFAVNQVVTRGGFVPRQDDIITREVYVPTLQALADPGWAPVNTDLSKMFEDYRDQNYSEAIAKAHSAVQRFLQIVVGEEGKSGKGEVGKLFSQAKTAGLIPVNRFSERIIAAIQGYLSEERATNSTAKPALKEATASDALLMMNVVMVLLQHCLQSTKAS